jgi:putative tryptophan/tyrosine transport system substrate-binding protein
MPPVAPRMESFRLALRQFGYIEGQTVAIELRYAEKGVRQLPELAAELVSRKVDVITAFGDLAPQVAQQATGRIRNATGFPVQAAVALAIRENQLPACT